MIRAMLAALVLTACQPIDLDALHIRQRIDERPIELIVTVIRIPF